MNVPITRVPRKLKKAMREGPKTRKQWQALARFVRLAFREAEPRRWTPELLMHAVAILDKAERHR